MPARTRKDQKMNMGVKKRHRTPPYESEKVAKKSEKVVKKSDTKPYATILSIFIEVLALFLPHACARIPQWLKFGFGFWTPAKNLFKYVQLRQQKNTGQRAHQRYDASFVH